MRVRLPAKNAPRRERDVAGAAPRKPRPSSPRATQTASPSSDKSQPRQPKAARAVTPERQAVTDISSLQIGQEIKVRAGKNAMDATVLEIAKDGVRVQLASGLAMIVRAEHLQF
ncbi:hypothetical protein DZS_28980 [Dickeya ananatis]